MMFESMLVIMIYVMGVFTPVLIPATIHAVHFLRDWRSARPLRAVSRVRLPRLLVSRRVAIPAAG
ncbi:MULTISPECIES: hypothetical protein [unclassified Mycobacterium]|uniref:hypothetical protein n=1 Tax=unclassified Mycobacterium TaxID=2642494 RepID=UPI0007FEDC8E|nr:MULTISPECIES: hypothetical protein [unclassified Mycobacterium]OBH01113.1 hypothetical protein A5696_14300 [Mycobacterium sp. E2699]OBI51297.1 hypothetical protein A5705_08965 [Mycobacterium sp. E787]